MIQNKNIESFISDYQKSLEKIKRLKQENKMLKLYILELSYELQSYHNNNDERATSSSEGLLRESN